jgi:hypothetical protein
MKFDVHVVDDEERPQSGLCVEVDLPESFPLSPLGGKATEYTDEDGRASFEMENEAFGEVTIYVSGENKGRFDLEEGAGLTIVV